MLLLGEPTCKVEHMSYTMGTSALPDIYALAQGLHAHSIILHVCMYMYHFHTSDHRTVNACII